MVGKVESSLGNIPSVLQGIIGVSDLLTEKKVKTKTSGGTTTQTSGLDISEAGRNKMIQDALASNSGLAEIASGQKRAGLFNSSTNQLLINDLLDRVTSSVDRDTAKQVTTTVASPTSTTQITPARVSAGDAALGIGGAVAAKKIFDIFSDDGTILNAGSGVVDALPDFVPAFEFGDALGSVGDIGGALGGFPVVGSALKFLSGEPEDAITSGLGFIAGNAILPGIGGPIGSILSEVIPFDDIFGEVGGLFGSVFSGSVVCTELHTQRKMSTELYVNDVKYAHRHMNPWVLEGYRSWGVPLVKLMRKSELVTDITSFFAINRAHYVAAIAGEDKVAYNPLRAIVGAAINAVGVPICYVIGCFLKTPVNTKQLYS